MIVINQFLCCEHGGATLEYALLAAVVSSATIAGASQIGASLDRMFLDVSSGFRKLRFR